MQSLVAAFLALAGLGLPASLLAQPRFIFHDLGTLGGPESQANGINNRGQVVGTSHLPDGRPHAFRTGPNVAIQPQTDDLGTLGGPGSTGNAINEAGQVVGSSVVEGSPEDHAYRATDNTLTDLGQLSDEGPAFATGINDQGEVAGYGRIEEVYRAFRTPGDRKIDPTRDEIAGPFDSGYYEVRDINNQGQIVGLFMAEGLLHAFLFAAGEMRDLGTLGEGIQTVAGINDMGQVALTVGGRAYLWSDGQFVDLQTPPGIHAVVEGLNAAGDVVGSANGRAVLFRERQMFDLNDLAGAGSGWTLETARAINDNGQIVGTARNMETLQPHAFRLDPIGSGRSR